MRVLRLFLFVLLLLADVDLWFESTYLVLLLLKVFSQLFLLLDSFDVLRPLDDRSWRRDPL